MDVTIVVQHFLRNDLFPFIHAHGAINGVTEEHFSNREKGHEQEQISSKSIMQLEDHIVNDNSIIKEPFEMAKNGENHDAKSHDFLIYADMRSVDKE